MFYVSFFVKFIFLYQFFYQRSISVDVFVLVLLFKNGSYKDFLVSEVNPPPRLTSDTFDTPPYEDQPGLVEHT